MNLNIPKLSLVVLIGPSGSGKSTFARKYFLPTEELSSDYWGKRLGLQSTLRDPGRPRSMTTPNLDPRQRKVRDPTPLHSPFPSPTLVLSTLSAAFTKNIEDG